MTERLVGSSPIGISHTGLDVSGFPFLRIPFLKELGTCLKNRFYAFLDTHMSGYNLSSILEQVNTGSHFPENGEPIRIPTKKELEAQSRFQVLEFLGTGNPPRFRVPRNGARN
jgi:hypothetical protein